MVNHLAAGLYATGAWTRVAARQVSTCSVSRAVRVSHALGPAAGVRVSKVSRAAGALLPQVWGGGAECVGAAGGGLAGGGRGGRGWRRGEAALLERVSGVAGRAAADWQVVPDGAAGVCPAGSGAGVHTVLAGASLVSLALGIDDALRPAGGRRSSVARQAAAHGSGAERLAGRVGTTGRGRAGWGRVWGRHRGGGRGAGAFCEWVSHVARWAAADGMVGHHLTDGPYSAAAGAGVLALAGQAGVAGRTV